MDDHERLKVLLKSLNITDKYEEILLRKNKMGQTTTFENNKLTRLDLSRLEIKELPEDIFTDLEDLREVKLFGNDLKSLPLGIFDPLPHLMEVHLKDNELKKLTKRHFKNNPRLFRLFLLGNPLPEGQAKVFPNRPAVESFLNLLEE